MKIKVSESLENFAKLVSKKADMFVVGGYVRNYLLGISNSDVDLASRLTTQELIKLTQNTPYTVKEKNKQLGTCTITIGAEVWEHSTFRKEKYPNDGSHKPSKVTFITDMREDAKRRDFTVNAIYYNIIKDEIVDIYSGLYDLKKRRIRAIETPDYVFENDGLRILRMIRQACELNFKIQRETYLKAKQRVYRLKDISGTRKAYELDRILNSSNKFLPSKQNAHMRGLKMLNMMDIWPSFFAGVTHINYSLVKKTSQQNRLIGLLIDLINTINPDCVSYYLEYALGKDGLNFSKAEQKDIIFIVSGYFDALNGLNNKMFFYNYYPYFERVGEILQKKSIFKYRKYNFYYKYINKFKIPTGLKDLKISGQDLKEHFPSLPQKKYSAVLFDVFNLVFDGKVKNEKELLLQEVKKLVDD
jgi:hypothetical protein